MPGNIATLAQVKTHLRYPNPTSSSPDDTMLQYFIGAADVVLEFECDDIIPQTYFERHDGGKFRIYLRHHPVVKVNNIRENWGWISYDLDFQDAGTPPGTTTMFGYGLDSAEVGEVSRRTVASVPIPFIPGEKNIEVEYVAGLQPIPGNILLAELELVAHWWQNSQLRAVALAGTNISYDATQGQVYTRDTESGTQNLNIGVPYRILELVKPHRRMPVIG